MTNTFKKPSRQRTTFSLLIHLTVKRIKLDIYKNIIIAR